MKSVELAFFVVEKTREIGRIDGSLLARFPGWDRVKAHRYLTKLANLGWLEKVSSHGHPTYVLGRKVLGLAVDFGRI
jgi:DNA-binding IclR family transcriptional regulator